MISAKCNKAKYNKMRYAYIRSVQVEREREVGWKQIEGLMCRDKEYTVP